MTDGEATTLNYERTAPESVSARHRAAWWLEVLALIDWAAAALMLLCEVLSIGTRGGDAALGVLFGEVVIAGIACWWCARRILRAARGAVVCGLAIAGLHGLEVGRDVVSFCRGVGKISPEMALLTFPALVAAVVVMVVLNLVRSSAAVEGERSLGERGIGGRLPDEAIHAANEKLGRG